MLGVSSFVWLLAREEGGVSKWVARRLAIFAGALTALELVDFAWPTSCYLLGFAAGAWLAHRVVREPKTDRARGLLETIATFVRDALLCASSGALLVCLAQVVLHWVAMSAGNIAKIRQMEDELVHVKEVLTSVLWLFPAAMAGVLAVLMMLTLAFTNRRFVRHLAVLRRWMSRLLVGVTVATSFTFLTHTTISDLSKVCAARRRTEVEHEAKECEAARRELAASALVEDRIAYITPKAVRGLQAFYAAARNTTEPAGATMFVAKRVAESAALAPDPTTSATAEPTWPDDAESSGRLAAWSQGRSSVFLTLDELRAASLETKKIRLVKEDLATSAAEQLGALVGDAMPDGLTRIFVDALIREIALRRIQSRPPFVRDAAGARRWARTVRRPAAVWDLAIQDAGARTTPGASNDESNDEILTTATTFSEAYAKNVTVEKAHEAALEAHKTKTRSSSAAQVRSPFGALAPLDLQTSLPNAVDSVFKGGGSYSGNSGGSQRGGTFGVRRPPGSRVVRLS